MQKVRQPWFSRVERLVILATTLSLVSVAGGIVLDRAGDSNPLSFLAPLQTFSSSTNPLILGDPIAASTLTAVPGTWSPEPEHFDYRWFSEGAPIDGADSSTYTLTGSDIGKKVTVAVTGSKDNYEDLPQSSLPTADVLSATFSATPSPSIMGTALVGATLTAVTDGWSPEPSSFSYKWFSGGVAVQEGSQPTYTVIPTDVGKKITLTVTAFLDGYTPVPKSSKALPIVPAPDQ
ncbi:hypothetical protein [Subtercola boreus]|uniref:Uncharacterized protein n=1 Tax=Subtercola boreus TaxID=120213 RepID=A0A3E0W8F0_9MICO|nr:hypothetical protein [Subtercola boreus]RFA19412.1 hypothetical protein B7R24_12295 [Subtercola boreus]RFA19673.1 hypothetical protein B7R23_12275 [Subtercola boreus]RFA26038.1 hypothetical protein B7R25_12395 [Subtercola boreus]